MYDEICKIDGWFSREDTKFLGTYANKVKGLIVEIGSYKGRTTKLLSLASPESKIITIDSFKMGGMRTKKALLKNIKGLNVVSVEGKSEEIGKIWNYPIDLLFIDGNHGQTAVEKDIELFVPHVKKGGYVLFHDYLAREYGVGEAVNKNFENIVVDFGMACVQI